jgi:uncharacterized membrane protein YdjX (TVP38/TMEM64 family)
MASRVKTKRSRGVYKPRKTQESKLNSVPKVESNPSKLPLIIIVSVVAVLAVCYFIFEPFRDTVKDIFETITSDDESRIRDWFDHFGFFGPLMIILAMAVQMFLFVVPNVLLMMIAIVSYGPVWGAVISFVGVFASSSLGYFIGRKLNPYTLDKFVKIETQKKISAFIKDYGAGAIVVTRLSSFSNDALSFVAGILEMSYKRYILSTLAGITPLIILLAVYGKNGKIEKGLIWITAASLVMLAVYIFIDKRRKKRRKQTS